MPFQNSSFEDAGTTPGEAEFWTLTSVTSLQEIAGFGVPEQAWEDFEGWYTFVPAFEYTSDVVRAFFDVGVDGIENFENLWLNDIYIFDLPPAQSEPVPFNGIGIEDCESGWSNIPYYKDWADVTSVAGSFVGGSRETFEANWRSNESYATSWASVTAVAAQFDVGVQPVEDFENSWTLVLGT